MRAGAACLPWQGVDMEWIERRVGRLCGLRVANDDREDSVALRERIFNRK